MSKKDYQAIARLIHEQRNIVNAQAERRDQLLGLSVIARVEDALADLLAAGNERFDRGRFHEACETGRCKGMPR